MRYTSKMSLFGLPLLHIATGPSDHAKSPRSIAKGWIAIGDIAFGIVLSLGGVAIGGIAIGGAAFGAASVAGLAVGVYALGGAAIAWHAALGGFALAHGYAQGGEAIAQHANDFIAHGYFENSPMFATAMWLAEHSRWLLVLAAIPIIQNMIGRKS